MDPAHEAHALTRQIGVVETMHCDDDVHATQPPAGPQNGVAADRAAHWALVVQVAAQEPPLQNGVDALTWLHCVSALQAAAHEPVLQKGVPPPRATQASSPTLPAWHAAQAFELQMGLPAVVHCDDPVHSTQIPVAVMQCGVAGLLAMHCVLELQFAVHAPPMQFGLAGFLDAHSASPAVPAVQASQRLLRQMGVVAVLHWFEPEHCTQVPALQTGLLGSRPRHCASPAADDAQVALQVPLLQNGVPGSRAAHAASPPAPATHAAHSFVVPQIGRAPGQSVDAAHSTQAPASAPVIRHTERAADRLLHSVRVEHAWHMPEVSPHTGVVPEQEAAEHIAPSNGNAASSPPSSTGTPVSGPGPPSM